MAKKHPKGETPEEAIARQTGEGKITNFSLSLSGRSDRHVQDELAEAFGTFVRALRALGISPSGSLASNDGTPASGFVLAAGDVEDEDEEE